ncbi:MAG TPA: YCF48-related protein [Pyrinomonadaceae bacterium]
MLCFQTARAAGWTKQSSGTFAWLQSIYFLNENKGWIVGSQGTFLSTDDSGNTWKQTRRFTEDRIRDVYFADEQTGWILCERDIYNLGSAPPSYLMKTTDGGERWEKVEFSGEGRDRIARMFFTKSGYGYAVGESGVFFAMQDDKKTWKKTPVPSRYLLLNGNFPDDSHGAIVGGGRTILFTEDAGLTWNKATVFGKSESRLNSIFFVNPRAGWTVGSNGKIYATTNAGKIWREQISNVNKDLLDVYFTSATEGWAVGDQGAILHTTTAGNVWLPIESNARHKLERVFFAGKKGFAVGFGGTILVYDSTRPPSTIKSKPQMLKRNQ